MADAARVRVTVLGDVNLELTCRVALTFEHIRENQLLHAPLNVVVGGTAANFAVAARAHFTTVRLVGVVGADQQGNWARAALQAAGVETRLRRHPDRPTGTVALIRDGTAPHGTRLMVVSPDSANHAFEQDQLSEHTDCFEETDLLVADGYSLLAEPRRGTVLAAMRRSAAAGAHVVLDLVPHHLDRLVNRSELEVWLAHVSIVVGEVGTLRRLLGLPVPDGTLDLRCALRTAQQLGAVYQDMAFLLRFGIDNVDQSLVCRPGHEPVHAFTGFAETCDTHGFGDRLTAGELARYFTGPALPPLTQPGSSLRLPT